MVSPGVTVTASAVAGIGNDARGSLGTWFVAGITELGPTTVDQARPVESLSEYVDTFGGRVPYGTLYDAVDAFFRAGGSRLRVARVVGPAATLSSLTLQDRAGTPVNTLTVKPKGPGAYGTRISVQVLDGTVTGTFQLLIRFDGLPREQSPDLASPTAAVQWSRSVSKLVDVTDVGSVTAAPANNPAVLAATALTGGTDDRAAITDTEWAAALARFTRAFGPGMVSQPGRTTSTAHAQTIAHGTTYGRQALLDGPADATASTLTSLAATLRGTAVADEFGALFAPWLKVPGVVANTTRLVPPSSVAAGLISRQVTSGSANVPAAGGNGAAAWVLDPGQAAFTDAERSALNDAGVNVFLRPYGSSEVCLYGYRTLDTTEGWRGLNNQLLRLFIVDQASLVGEDFVFDQLDGRGQKIAEFGSAVGGILHDLWVERALHGDTAPEAYRVDVGPGVNTPVSLAAGELRAAVAVRMSPMAEFVVIEITKYPVNESLVA